MKIKDTNLKWKKVWDIIKLWRKEFIVCTNIQWELILKTWDLKNTRVH